MATCRLSNNAGCIEPLNPAYLTRGTLRRRVAQRQALAAAQHYGDCAT